MSLLAPEKPQKIDFVRKYWYVFFLMWAFFMAALAILLRLLLGDQAVPIQDNSWQGVTPGFSTKQQVEKKFGQPLGSSPLPAGTAYFYQPPYKTLQQNTVVYDTNNKVLFVKENVDVTEKQKLSAYIDSYGESDLTVGNPDVGEGVIGHVFLSKGVVVFAHVLDGSVEQKWYFTPTDAASFTQTWKTFILPDQTGPHE